MLSNVLLRVLPLMPMPPTPPAEFSCDSRLSAILLSVSSKKFFSLLSESTRDWSWDFWILRIPVRSVRLPLRVDVSRFDRIFTLSRLRMNRYRPILLGNDSCYTVIDAICIVISQFSCNLKIRSQIVIGICDEFLLKISIQLISDFS